MIPQGADRRGPPFFSLSAIIGFMRNTLLLLVIVLGLCLVLVAGVAAALFIWIPANTASVPQPFLSPAETVIANPAPGTTSRAGGTPSPGAAPSAPASVATVAPRLPMPSNDTLDRLLGADIPRNAPLQVVPRLQGKGPVSEATAPAARQFLVGDKSPFWVSRDITGTYELITATLRYANSVVYMWVEDGVALSDADIKKGADTFANQTYPTNHAYFGSEWSPGIDNDPRVFVLNTRFRNAAGYFSSTDEYPSSIRPFSNQHEIFYINSDVIRPGGAAFDAVMAHEFTHMIHWFQNGHEATWITEGLGDMGIRVNKLRPEGLEEFTRQPNLQLTGWTDVPNQSLAYYEASYLLLSFGLDHFGEQFLHDIVSSGTRDIASIQRALDRNAAGLRFDDFFADWVVANVVNNLPAAGDRFSYKVDRPRISPRTISSLPFNTTATVSQYGTQYYALENLNGDVQIDFRGDAVVKAIPPDAHSGKQFWWSHRADMSDTSLTRTVDLSGVKNATLKFWTWYDIEDGFDYAYVTASVDGGKTWKSLPGKRTTNSNPNGANNGNGMTGNSGGQWYQEQMDLSPFAGNKTMLRFEYVTDDAYVAPGLALDDLEIPEINWRDDAEREDGGWKALGFVRMDNALPQRFAVQVVQFGKQFRVDQITLDASNSGSLTLKGLGGDISRAIIAVSGRTPITWEKAGFQLSVRASGGR